MTEPNETTPAPDADADTGPRKRGRPRKAATGPVAGATQLQALIEEIEAGMHHSLMGQTIATLQAREALKITEEAGLVTVALAGIENTSTMGGLVAMQGWCEAVRRHLLETAA